MVQPGVRAWALVYATPSTLSPWSLRSVMMPPLFESATGARVAAVCQVVARGRARARLDPDERSQCGNDALRHPGRRPDLHDVHADGCGLGRGEWWRAKDAELRGDAGINLRGRHIEREVDVCLRRVRHGCSAWGEHRLVEGLLVETSADEHVRGAHEPERPGGILADEAEGAQAPHGVVVDRDAAH